MTLKLKERILADINEYLLNLNIKKDLINDYLSRIKIFENPNEASKRRVLFVF